MNDRRHLAGLLGAMLLAGCAVNTPSPSSYPPVPALVVETVPNPPVTTTPLIWQPGHWNWNGANYVWEGGQYVPRTGLSGIWQPGYWTRGPSGGWVWQPAHWQ
jgi:WXXGXW repeat (2 copies)